MASYRKECFVAAHVLQEVVDYCKYSTLCHGYNRCKNTTTSTRPNVAAGGRGVGESGDVSVGCVSVLAVSNVGGGVSAGSSCDAGINNLLQLPSCEKILYGFQMTCYRIAKLFVSSIDDDYCVKTSRHGLLHLRHTNCHQVNQTC